LEANYYANISLRIAFKAREFIITVQK